MGIHKRFAYEDTEQVRLKVKVPEDGYFLKSSVKIIWEAIN
jgi:hypothetical protein